MDKSLVLYTLIGIAFFYVVTHYVGNIQKEDERYRNNQYNSLHEYDQYNGVDSIGNPILLLSTLPLNEQISVWNASKLKKEYMKLFPRFDAMKVFIKERVEGDKFQNILLKNIKDVEDKYFSGAFGVEQAKHRLDYIK